MARCGGVQLAALAGKGAGVGAQQAVLAVAPALILLHQLLLCQRFQGRLSLCWLRIPCRCCCCYIKRPILCEDAQQPEAALCFLI
ncbi:MAG: hypothetical protein CUN51_08200 [Candidatus Thermofonsia Clade 1 bacterium]|uniref:Uncharacterized protein n=1 Tax=Candidatus Thermofonsia Clade 1 bacterium TaxID=2364210 RepID=A0A2M8NYA4_9CHLR|nr:MAG: hypothetical protein CUN51_08200 [Candidatus Thermofonsia Clade 1 bacterium]